MNHSLLLNAIDNSDISKSKIAESLGLTRQGLYKKLNGLCEFKASEIRKLSNILSLSNDDINQIFFNDYVDNSANRNSETNVS